MTQMIASGFCAGMAALQQALRTLLLADGALASLVGTRIHDGPPARTGDLPFLAFANAEARDWSTGDAGGQRVDLKLEAVSREGGRAEALAVIEAVEAAVAASGIDPAGVTLVLLRTDRMGVERLSDGRTWRASLTLRALIEA
ncbi:hypothetical protein HDIA_1343 [Hartmannibacter diazotrophicus]|uniref:Gene transfer agent protein n=1 Tax=Hartmannibacter diazotrophicus TaxID=1482074 RepID=A0A2C9D3N6_9HYPH|nr:DUF3168 domain-containing protein [Hartmannibacter diazotrophicus]SON54884.1 hypothetical protein HDIA_1343 [Hartmannibacter diazotrophicus]